MSGVRIMLKRKFYRGRTRVSRELQSTGIYGKRVSGTPHRNAVRERR